MEKPRPQTWTAWLKLLICGFFMGMADLVPGISGGTVAFISGIYEDLLHSIGTINAQSLKDLLRFRWKAFREDVAWEYLLGVGSGVLIALLSLSRVIRELMSDPSSRTLMYAAFLGFIAASAWICWRMLVKPSWSHLFALLAGVCIAYGGTQLGKPKGLPTGPYSVELHLSQVPEGVVNYDAATGRLSLLDAHTLAAMLARKILPPKALVTHVDTGEAIPLESFARQRGSTAFQPWVVFCGAIAISAMLLPGVSGSYLLNALGMYLPVIAALADLSSGDPESLYFLANLGVGIVFGGLLFARLVSWLLDHYHQSTISALIGLMLGALPTIWPFWATVRVLRPLKLHQTPLLLPVEAIVPSGDWLTWAAGGTAVLSFVIVAAVESAVYRKSAKQA